MKTIDLLQKVTTNSEGFDWRKKRKNRFSFVNPPRIKDIDKFKDGLKSVIPLKINEAIKRQRQLEKEQRKRQKIIEKISVQHQWFWKEFDIAFFEEYFIIEKWLRYWTRIYEEISGEWKKVEDEKEGISDRDIEKAREYPIEDLYVGNLRRSGSRLTGQCPFHEERNGSFFIFEDNHWHCFGCNAGGDSINFIMKLDEIDFKGAIKKLI